MVNWLAAKRDLRLVQRGSTSYDGPILALICRNERLRLPFYLDYYRSIGFRNIIVIDNESNDGSRDYLQQQSDVTLFSLRFGTYYDLRYILYVNHVLSRFARNRWVLHADVDELLVHPQLEMYGIAHFCDIVDAKGLNSVWTPMIDMYPENCELPRQYHSGSSFLECSDRYDCLESYQLQEHIHRFDLRGGPRARLFCNRNLSEAPQCSKTSLFKWNKGVVFGGSPHLTSVGSVTKARVIAPLLHFKFLHDFSKRADVAVLENQHWNDAEEYRVYKECMDSQKLWVNLESTETRKFRGSGVLLEEIYKFAKANIPGHFDAYTEL